MRILYVSHSIGAAGAEKWLLQMLTAVDRREFEPLVAIPEEGGPLGERITAMGVRSTVCPNVWAIDDPRDPAHLDRFARDLRERVAHLARVIETERIDVVVTNTAVVVEGALAAAQTRRPHVWRVHELLGIDPCLVPLVDPGTWYRIVGELSDHVSVVCEALRTHWERLMGSASVHVLRNGLEDEVPPPADRESLGLGSATPMVAFVGTLSETKGVTVLPQVLEQVRRSVPGTVCLVMGTDGGAGAELERGIQARGLNDAFRVLGFRPDARSLMACSDVVVLPSRVDAFPYVALEAMACSRPLVATRSGGASEIVVHGETGLLTGSDPSEIAEAVSSVLRDPALARALGERGRDHVRSELTVARCAAGWRRALEEAARTLPGSGRSDAGSLIASLLVEVARWRSLATRMRVHQEIIDRHRSAIADFDSWKEEAGQRLEALRLESERTRAEIEESRTATTSRLEALLRTVEEDVSWRERVRSILLFRIARAFYRLATGR